MNPQNLFQARDGVQESFPVMASKGVAAEEFSSTLNPRALWQLQQSAIQGSSAFMVEVIDLYLEQAHNLVNTMQRAVAEADFGMLRRSAHTLRSSSAALGADRFAELCSSLEATAAAENQAQAVLQYAELQTTYQDVQTALQEERQKYQNL